MTVTDNNCCVDVMLNINGSSRHQEYSKLRYSYVKVHAHCVTSVSGCLELH